MEIKARQVGNIVVLELSGRIDVDAANLVEAVGQCVRDGYTDILCDLEEVEFIDYLGISAIVLAYKEVLNAKGRMKFMHVPLSLKNIFTVAGLDRVIEMHSEEEQALHSFKEDKVIEKIKKMQLRRRFKRLPIDIKVELKSKSEREPACLKLDLVNLSAIGAYIFGCDKFRLGDEVVLKMRLPPKGQELQLDAKVVWLPDKQIQPHAYPGVGVEFTDIPDEKQKILLEFIERNLSFLSQE